jgi:hypothetical protein
LPTDRKVAAVGLDQLYIIPVDLFSSAASCLARYPQFYSRIGFVHEFRPLSAAEMRRLLLDAWTPPGVHLPSLDADTMAAIGRITGGNFRLLGRLLAQTERIIEIYELPKVTRQAVETARESLVIGQAG